MNNRYSKFDNLIEGIQIIDRDFRYVYLNDAIVQQSRATRESMIGFTMMERYPGIEKTEVFQHIIDCLKHQASKRMLNEFKFPGGEIGFFELSIQPIDDSVLIMSVDVTEKKIMERELLRSHEQLELSQELALIGSYDYDLLNDKVKWSPTTFTIMGRNEKDGEPEAKDLKRQIHPDDTEKMNQAIQNAIATGMPYMNEYRIITFDGKAKNIRAIAKPVRNEQGHVTLIRGCIQDITTQKANEIALDQKERSYRLLFEGIQESFVVHELVTGDNGEIVDLRFKELNPVSEKALGKPKSEIIGRTRSEILGPLDAEMLEMVKNVALRGESVNFERYIPTIDRWFNVLIYSPQAGQIATLNLDITAQKKSLENLQKLNADLERRVRERTQELLRALEHERELNELKSRFVTIASHEFRTPLTTLLSSTFLIDELIKAGKIDKTPKHTQRIKDSVRNLTSILEDFLSLEKLDQGKISVAPEHFNRESFVHELVDKLNAITKVGQQIIHKHQGPVDLCLDKKILENILINLLSNAIKYSSKDVNLSSSIKDNKLLISVCDQGIGIPEADQKHLFEMFFRASNAGNIQGTGLGLNIVKRYIELLGGSIDFISSPKGTTFNIQVPI